RRSRQRRNDDRPRHARPAHLSHDQPSPSDPGRRFRRSTAAGWGTAGHRAHHSRRPRPDSAERHDWPRHPARPAMTGSFRAATATERLLTRRISPVITLLLLAPLLLHARVTKINITAHDPAAYPGYEKIKGIATGELDPKDRRNAIITDIALAPKNAAGRVEYRTNFTIVKPLDMSKASGVMLFNVVN